MKLTVLNEVDGAHSSQWQREEFLEFLDFLGFLFFCFFGFFGLLIFWIFLFGEAVSNISSPASAGDEILGKGSLKRRAPYGTPYGAGG